MGQVQSLTTIEGNAHMVTVNCIKVTLEEVHLARGNLVGAQAKECLSKAREGSQWVMDQVVADASSSVVKE